MSEISKKYLVITIIVFFLAVSLFVIMIQQVDSESKKLAEQVLVIAEQQSKESDYINLQRQKDETKADRERLQTLFLRQDGDSVDFLERLNNIELLAKQVGIVFSTDALELVGGETTNAGWLRVNFSFAGPDKEINDFILMLENLPYLLKITDLEMRREANNQWKVKMVAEIRTFAYEI